MPITAANGHSLSRFPIAQRPLFVAIVLFLVAVIDARATDAVDVYGRPLRDASGPLRYVDGPTGWNVRHADGAVTPAWGPATSASESKPGEQPDEPPTRLVGFGLSAYVATAVGSWPESVAIGDVTGDGRPDVVLTTTFYFDDEKDYHVFVFPQTAGGGLGSPQPHAYGATASRSGLVLADLDEDGLLDVVVGHADGISVLLADGAGGLADAVVTESDVAGDTLAATDVDGDQHLDVIALGWTSPAAIYLGDGKGVSRKSRRSTRTRPASTISRSRT